MRDATRHVSVEAKWDDLFDEVWVCVAEPAVAISRLMARNKLTEDAARQRQESQISQEERCRDAKVILRNDGSEDELRAAVSEEWVQLHTKRVRAMGVFVKRQKALDKLHRCPQIGCKGCLILVDTRHYNALLHTSNQTRGGY